MSWKRSYSQKERQRKDKISKKNWFFDDVVILPYLIFCDIFFQSRKLDFFWWRHHCGWSSGEKENLEKFGKYLPSLNGWSSAKWKMWKMKFFVSRSDNKVKIPYSTKNWKISDLPYRQAEKFSEIFLKNEKPANSLLFVKKLRKIKSHICT